MTRPQLQVTPPPDEGPHDDLWCTGAEIRPVAPSWLLPGRILANGLCVLEGDPHAGKSTFLSHLVASVTTGRAWLGRPKQAPANVLWLSSEEDYASMMQPRLVAAGADESRVITPRRDKDGVIRPLYLPQAVGRLRDAVHLRGLTLIVVEPLVSYVPPEISLNQEGPARSVCDPLNRLAMETNCCIIVTRGLRKDRSGPRLSHGSGHGTISNTARSVLVIDRPDPERERRVLRCLKVYGRPPSAMHYDHQLEGKAPPKIVGLVELAGDADDALAQTVSPGERGARADARVMLKMMCATEYVPVNTVKQAADDSGIGWRTVQEVKAELGIHSRPNRTGGTFFHEWGPPEGGWAPPTTPVRSTDCALPPAKKSRRKTKKSEG